MSRRRDFYAAKLSLARVLGDEGWCYLWTFTTPDVVDAKTLSSRWTRFRNHRTIKALKLRALRVIEQHPGGHGFHMHFVTPQRLDAGTMWSVDCFGHVEPLPLVPGTILDGSRELTHTERLRAELASSGFAFTERELEAAIASP